MDALTPVRATRRGKRPGVSLAEIFASYQRIALVFQGGGALGAYQGGVYTALEEAGCAPNWLSGVSIGAINASIIAGNRPADRLDQLRRFWDFVLRLMFQTSRPLGRRRFQGRRQASAD